MPKKPLKLPVKETAESETKSPPKTEAAAAPSAAAPAAPSAAAIPERRTQRRTSEPGRYWLQVDRQTKSSYDTAEAAATAGLIIKKQFAMVQVAVYDRQEGSNRILE